MKSACSIAECSHPAAARGWCEKHYTRWKRHGDPLIRRDRRIHGAICSFKDCSAPTAARGWCRTHYGRWLKHGSPHVVMPHRSAGDDVLYRGLHKRLDRVRGSAATHSCVDCGGTAAQWSYQGGEPDERTSSKGCGYSLNLHAYAPRCVRCHQAHDDNNLAQRRVLT